MVKVTIQFEIQDRMGRGKKSFWKDIEMPSAPFPGLVIDDNDIEIVMDQRSIFYQVRDGSYYYRKVVYEAADTDDPWEPILLKEGWKKRY